MSPDHCVSITVSPRVHIGLISMHEGGPRRNGGIGFSLLEPTAIVTADPAEAFALSDRRGQGFTTSEVAQLRDTIDGAMAVDALASNVRIGIAGSMRTHVGMGSGTAIRLAVLEALYLINGAPRSRRHLIARSLRGGTSGIGINTYFDGGLVFDLGVKGDATGFLPSSKSRPKAVPTALPPLIMPDWPLCVCLPRNIRPKSQEEEVEFFKRVTPLPPATSYRAAYDALFGIYAAVADADRGAFCQAVTSMQGTSWKKAEWREYGKALEHLRDQLTHIGVDCVGMSSLGPMLFCFGDDATLKEVTRQQDELDCDVIWSPPNNTGRVVIEARHA